MNPAIAETMLPMLIEQEMARRTAAASRPPSTTKKVVVGVILGAGAILVGRYFFLKWRALQFQKRAYLPGSAEAYAQMIRLAMHNDNFLHWGTDNETLRQVFIAIPSKEYFRKVIDAYAGLYSNDSMMGDLKSELKTSEYKEMLAIIASKPDTGNAPIQIQLNETQFIAWADRLDAAFDYHNLVIIPATDEDAIYQVITEIPTQAAFEQLKGYYYKKYGRNLVDALDSELAFWEYNKVMDMIHAKP